MYGEQYFLLAAVLVTGLAAWFDWRTGHLPNRLTLGTLAAAPLLHAAIGLSKAGWTGCWQGAAFSLAGAIACLIVPAVLYFMGGIYGGDVKLLGALGALLLPMVGMEAELYSFLVAALYAPARLAWEGKLFHTLGNSALLVRNWFVPKAKRREVPQEMMAELRFAPSIFVATCVTVLLHFRI